MEENLEIVKRSTLFKTFSQYYSALGLNITFINANSGEINPDFNQAFKTPTFHIDNLFYEKQDFKNLLSYKWEIATGLGAVTGYNNIRCLDFDNCRDENFIKKFLYDIGLPRDYEWVVRSGSHNGFHIWFKLEEEPSNNIMDDHGAYVYMLKGEFRSSASRIELRWRAHVVLPPSIHGSKKNYEFLFQDLPKSQPKQISGNKLYSKLDELCIDKIKEEKYKNDVKKYKLEKHHFVGSEHGQFIPGDMVLFFDIETTGLPKDIKGETTNVNNWPFIVQIAWKWCYPKDGDFSDLTCVYERDFILDCTNINIPDNVSKIHGITNDFSQNQNNIPRSLVLDHLAWLIDTSHMVVCHNTDFDINVLKCELFRNDIYSPFKEQKIVCTMKQSTEFCKMISSSGNLKWPTLKELYEILFDKTISGAHNAKNDVNALKECFVELVRTEIIKPEKIEMN